MDMMTKVAATRAALEGVAFRNRATITRVEPFAIETAGSDAPENPLITWRVDGPGGALHFAVCAPPRWSPGMWICHMLDADGKWLTRAWIAENESASERLFRPHRVWIRKVLSGA